MIKPIIFQLMKGDTEIGFNEGENFLQDFIRQEIYPVKLKK